MEKRSFASAKGEINLLPPEFLYVNKHSKKEILANRLSVGVLAVVLFFTTILFTLNILQSSRLNELDQNMSVATSQVSALSREEGYVFILNDRLKSIRGQTSAFEKTDLFNLAVAIAPSGLQVTLLSVDRVGNLTVSISTVSLEQFDRFLSDLLNREINSDMVSKVDVENFSKSRDGVFRVNLKIHKK
jgi:hypothetical protein